MVEYQVVNLCQDSDDNYDGEWPNTNTASLSPVPLSRKRPRDNKKSSNISDAHHPSNENDEIPEGDEASERDVCISEDAQVADHRESREGIAAAEAAAEAKAKAKTASHPMNSDSEQTSRDDDWSENKDSRKLSTSKPPSNASGRQWKASAWEDSLSELANYRKIYGHCNVPRIFGKSNQLAEWVITQRSNYRLHLEGKASAMTTLRIQELESLGFEWSVRVTTAWEGRLSELANYRKIHGHCNVPKNYSENTKLASWVTNQRHQYRLQLEGKTSLMTTFRIQAWESFGFERNSHEAAWEERLGELADYRKSHGHCNVPRSYSENTQLGSWVRTQRNQYKLHLEGKTSYMTLSRFQELDCMGFEWDCSGATWEDRLSELADYRKIRGHCNVPKGYSENTKLAAWVATQRKQYRLHLKGKPSTMTTLRIQELESLGFEWVACHRTTWEDHLSELSDYRKIHGHCNIPNRYSENAKLGKWVGTQRTNYKLHLEGKTSWMTLSRIQELESLGFEWRVCHGAAWEKSLSELADYRKIHGHCNVPQKYIENFKLGKWVAHQRCNYRLHLKGKPSAMTTLRIQELESLGFEWSVCVTTAWEDRLSELADYRKIHGHCNIPGNNSENPKLGMWVTDQRRQYRLQLDGKKSPLTTLRIQALESLGFEWTLYKGRRKGIPKKLSLDDSTRVLETAVAAPEHVQRTAQPQNDFSGREICRKQVDVASVPEESYWNGEVHLGYIPGRTEQI
jgi:hypothetical protein